MQMDSSRVRAWVIISIGTLLLCNSIPLYIWLQVMYSVIWNLVLIRNAMLHVVSTRMKW